MNKKKTNKSHYIPKFYLKYFCSCDANGKNCKLAIYDVKTKKLFEKGPGGIFWKKYFYSLTGKRYDSLGQEIEDAYAVQEKKSKEIHDELIDSILKNEKIKKGLLHDFIESAISIFVRTESFKEHSDNLQTEMIDFTLEIAEEHKSESVNGVKIEDIKKMKEDVTSNNKNFFDHSSSYANILQILKDKKVTFYVIEENSPHNFFSGNNPFMDISKKKTGHFLENSILNREQFFVLNPKILVKFYNQFLPGEKIEIKKVDDLLEIFRLNNKISLRQDKYLINKNKKNIEYFILMVDKFSELFPELKKSVYAKIKKQ